MKSCLARVKIANFFPLLSSFLSSCSIYGACSPSRPLTGAPGRPPKPTENRDMATVNHSAARCRISVVCPWGGEEGVKGGIPGSVLLQWSAMSRRAEEEQTSGCTRRRQGWCSTMKSLASGRVVSLPRLPIGRFLKSHFALRTKSKVSLERERERETISVNFRLSPSATNNKLSSINTIDHGRPSCFIEGPN